MTDYPVSVVIVSRDRPTWLRRCLMAVGQLDYAKYEVIVVACARGVAVAEAAGLPVETKVISYDEANISAARNMGVAQARGEIIAFIDDDAVPEPTWLQHLTGAFDSPDVVQAGGTTLGRNGISVQHAAARVTLSGETVDIAVDGEGPVWVPPTESAFPRVHGTNMAIRHETLVALGGFDERYAFYLDETDLSFRVGQAGGATAHVPKAVVHHASAESATRRADRVPRDLFEIGASAGVFHGSYLSGPERVAARDTFFEERRRWLLQHLQNGSLTPDDVTGLMQGLKDGYEAGLAREQVQTVVFYNEPTGDIPTKSPDVAADLYLVARTGTRQRSQVLARAYASQGHRVTLFDYRPSSAYHRVSFTDDGYWLHRGGIFGRELRDEPLWQPSWRSLRVRRTLSRIAGIRANAELIRAR